MGKKKTNPNKKPIAADTFDIDQTLREAANRMSLHAWILFFGAMADFRSTTAENLITLWDQINAFENRTKDLDGIARIIEQLEKATGRSIPYVPIAKIPIKNQGDIKKFKRRAELSAYYSATALIAETVMQNKLLSEEDFRQVISKVFSLHEEIVEGFISIMDIQSVLEDEYLLAFVATEDGVCLAMLTPE